MIEKQSKLSSIGVDGDCSLYVVINMMVVEDGDVISMRQPHRTCIDGGGDIQSFITTLNDNLVNFYGYPALSQADIDKITAHFALVPAAPESEAA